MYVTGYSMRYMSIGVRENKDKYSTAAQRSRNFEYSTALQRSRGMRTPSAALRLTPRADSNKCLTNQN